MHRWEYKIVSIDPRPEPGRRRGKLASLEDLDALGADGWEAVGMSLTNGGSIAGLVALFKRPIDPADASAVATHDA